jgi:hypothetical protein
MTKTEILALADALSDGWIKQKRMFEAASALREYAGMLEQEPVGTVTHAGHVDWYDQQPPPVWTNLYTHPREKK